MVEGGEWGKGKIHLQLVQWFSLVCLKFQFFLSVQRRQRVRVLWKTNFRSVLKCMTMSSIINSPTTIFASDDFLWQSAAHSHICCIPSPWGPSPKQAAHSKQDSSHLSVKVKNSCPPKHVRVNLLSNPSTGEANFKLACEVCLWGDFHLVYPHLPSSRWANFPAAETSGCHTVTEVIKKKKPGISQALQGV